MPQPRLILVGGFLGAGKTTLLAQAAVRLTKLGRRVGLLANDQAADLVDTEILRLTGACVEEVAGGCFCCRFPDMVAALARLADRDGADVLLGEPVGSCTDLAATVMHPLRDLHAAQFDLAPLSVLVDGRQVRTLARLRAANVSGTLRVPLDRHTECAEYNSQRFPDNVLYIYEKQLEEADLIVLNKADRLAPAELAELTESLLERFPHKPVAAMSALTGDGVEPWLDHVLKAEAESPHVVEVDYDAYADGEAALGWLNASLGLHSAEAVNWRKFAEDLLTEIRKALLAQAAEIAHLKVVIRRGDQTLLGNLTDNSGPVSLVGALAEASGDATMRLNARVRTASAELHAICNHVLQRACSAAGLHWQVTALRALNPSRPVPTHRYAGKLPSA